MKKKANLILVAVGTVFLFTMACTSGRKDYPLSEDDKKAIQSVLNIYATGWNAENPQESIKSLFVEDAVLMPHHGDPQVKGKGNIRNHFWPPGLSGFKVNFYDFDIMEITGRADLAYSRGRYSISFSFESDGESKTLNNAGNYVMLFRKVEDEWKISGYIWNDPAPKVQQ